MSVTFGKPNYSGNTSNYEAKTIYHKLGHKTPQQRTLKVRIAPPYGTDGEKGIWSRYIKQHFGYGLKIVTKGGEQKFIPTTFLCIEQKDRQGNITRHCAECDEIAKQKKKLDDKTKELTAQKKTDEEIDAATRYIAAWTKDHNLDKKWHMVAKNLEAQWGFLTVSHTCYKRLKGNEKVPGLMDTLIAKRNIDPLSPEKGIWFEFTRSGEKWHEIDDIPAALKEVKVINGDEVEVLKFDSLTQADIDALEKLPALSTLGRTLSGDQIQMLVSSGGSEEVVRAVMNMPVQSQAPVKTEGQVLADEPEEEPVEEVAKSVAETVTAVPAEDDEEKALLAQMAALKAKKAAANAAAVAKPATTPAVTPKLAEELGENMDSFLAKYK